MLLPFSTSQAMNPNALSAQNCSSMPVVRNFETQVRPRQRPFITGTTVMTFTKLLSSFLNASMALALQFTPALAANIQSPDALP
ncbi:hypothetical protein [Acetobacter malorum]|uniref:hypothetical protein n=1 Tax=Acetobacter malorum TaxID=178901 RepID=UPI0012E72E2F|nr:hypothetical protein [Acetobacter malorum]